MAADIAKLERILRLEAADNYKDQKVFRGLAAFISNWTRDSLKTNPTPPEARLIEIVADRLIEYNAMTTLQRARAIQGVLDAMSSARIGLPPDALATLTAPPTAPKPVAARRLPPRESPAPAAAPVKKPRPAPEPAKPAATSTKTVAPVETPVKLTTSKTAAKPASTGTVNLQAPLTVVKGVGETYAKLLSFINLRTIHDALYYFPFRHEDFSSFKKINELMFNQTESVIARVVDTVGIRTSGGKEIIEVVIEDETGRMSCYFFNRRMTLSLKPGEEDGL